MVENTNVFELINEDGTSMEDFPKNPLQEKWDKLYPPIPKVEYQQVCDGYSCMWCGRCPNGENWIVPEEDLEIWNNYQEQIKQYHQLHNPNFIKNVDKILEKVLTKDNN